MPSGAQPPSSSRFSLPPPLSPSRQTPPPHTLLRGKPTTAAEIHNDKSDSCWLGTWHWGESGPRRSHSSRRSRIITLTELGSAGPRQEERGRENECIIHQSSAGSASTATALWKHKRNENPIDPELLPFRKIALFSLPINCLEGDSRRESQNETPEDGIVNDTSWWGRPSVRFSR